MPETPEEWRDDLLTKLDARLPTIKTFHDYYDGDHAVPRLPEKCNNDIKRLVRDCVLNLCALVVDAPIERLEVQGFQFGSGSDDATDVWRDIWQPNRLDADSDLVHAEALIARRSFVSVWPGDNGIDIFPESPAEVYVDYEPGRRRKRRAAVKRFHEGDGQKKVTDVTVWLPGQVYRWRSAGASKTWDVVDESTGPAPAALGDEIPIVEFLANPDLSGRPHSELDRGVLAAQDRLNKTIFDRLVLAEFQAFPQRWAVGVAPEIDDDGNAVQPFGVGPNKVVTNADPAVKFGQWDAADLGPLLKAIEADIHAVAAMTKVPVYYLAAEFSNVSADALRAAEAGLVKKVQRHQRVFGESWEEVIRLALRLQGDPRASDLAGVIEWADPETRTMAELADSVVKLKEILPTSELHRLLGYSPQDRERLANDGMGDTLRTRAAGLTAVAS